MSFTTKIPPWTLGEGNTPLVHAVRHGDAPGKLSFKLESANPTGSYKDRFVVAEVQRLLATGATACVATSSGNTGSSLATYCARAGLGCVIVVNEHSPEGKLQQMSAHGAYIIRVPGFVTRIDTTRTVFDSLSSLAQTEGLPLVVSAFAYCPIGMQGVETISAELVSKAPDHVFVPVGGAGLYSAIVRGFRKYATKIPRVHAVQPSGCLTLVGAYQNDTEDIPVPDSTTRISGLSVTGNLDASRALALLRQCNGTGIAVEDREVFVAQRELFLEEGIYCEPAGATSFAGWKRAMTDGTIRNGESSVCIITGHGFKDPLSASHIARSTPVITSPAEALPHTILNRLAETHG